MSIFSKLFPKGEESAREAPHAPAAGERAPPQAVPPKPSPAVVVSRVVNVTATPTKPRPVARPEMPDIHLGDPPPLRLDPLSERPPAEATPPDVARADPRSAPAPAEEGPLSWRPTAPDLATQDHPASIADTFERLLGEVDAGFDALEAPMASDAPPVELAPADLNEVRQLFAQLAANHVRQVRDFLIELRWGEATVDWAGICEPAVSSLRRAAEKLEFAELATALAAFGAALAAAHASGLRVIEGERRSALLERYDRLTALMPDAFALDMDRERRETVILQSLLMQIPDVKKVTIDKLYAAGMTTLETMLLTKPNDIVATTGIDLALAERIVERFHVYREEVVATRPDATRSREREQVSALARRLRQEHEEYERAASDWSREGSARKKQLRRTREKTLLDIQVLLARLGEVDRLKELEKVPFELKLTLIDKFLREAEDEYAAAP
jgi:hypothetical protein